MKLFKSSFVQRFLKRLTPFMDIGFWLLTIISLVPLLILNTAMALTMLQWCAFFVAFAGLAILICRILMPQIDLSEWLDEIRHPASNSNGSTGAGLVVLSVALLLSAILLSLVLWAKA